MSARGQQIGGTVDRDRLVGRLAELVRTRSENPPGDEAAAGAVTESYCRDLGLDVEIHEAEPGRPNVIARTGTGKGPTLTYCSHIDVVPAGNPALWDRDPYSAHIADGVMHGRGSADAKGPCAAAIEAVNLLLDAGTELNGTLELAFVSDEEAMGFKGAGWLVEQGIVEPDLAIVGEPTSLRLVRAQRGANWIRLTTHGLAGHGSAPERGRNAINYMSEVVSHIESTVPDVSHEVLGGPSINVGTITGGEKVNIIPASCSVEIDRRSIPGETPEELIAQLEAAVELAKARYPELTATVELMFAGMPFEIDPTSELVSTVADAIASVTDKPAELIGFRGASDARFMAEMGAQTIVLGPGDIATAHTAREHVDLDEVEACALIYARAFAGLLS
jgi:acetylornithine deacetylase/succinyl-diaminopimelate desuccinylase family protein